MVAPLLQASETSLKTLRPVECDSLPIFPGENRRPLERRYAAQRHQLDAQLLHDMDDVRRDRLAEQGYAAIPDARAFLALARRGRPTEAPNVAGSRAPREADAAATFGAWFGRPEPHLAPAGIDPAVLEQLRIACPQLGGLGELGTHPPQPRALLGDGASGEVAAPLPDLRAFMERLRAEDESVYLARSGDLATLANVLVSGCSLQGRVMTPQEGAAAAAAVCNLALERLGPAAPGQALDVSLVDLFQDGWATLHHEVGLAVARGLVETLRDVGDGTETHAELQALRRRAVSLCDAGTPWLLRDALDPVATLDPLAWTALLGLLSECPVIPEALTAIVERRRGAVSPTAFAFVSTRRQIGQARTFMTRLPSLLA